MLSGGLLGHFERLGVNRDLTDFGLVRQVSVHIPTSMACTAVGCGYDTFTHSALDPACPTCSGQGTVDTWQIGYARVRLAWADPARINLYKGIASGEVGDAQVQGFYHDLALFERVRDTDRAYILADTQHLKPYSITQNQVEGQTTLDVRCNLQT
jgi:hypothetical protein